MSEIKNRKRIAKRYRPFCEDLAAIVSFLCDEHGLVPSRVDVGAGFCTCGKCEGGERVDVAVQFKPELRA